VNWGTLTPAEAFEALSQAPKVAGPWRMRENLISTTADRRDPHGRIVAWERTGTLAGVYVHWWALAEAATENRFATRKAADDALSRAGWILVDDGKAK
jgi:hypothetical protein